MNTQKTLLALSVLGALALAGCNNGNTVPPGTDSGNHAVDMGMVVHDAGNDAATPTVDSGMDAAAPMSDGGHDAASTVDAFCMSTMPHCNTCVTAMTDPYNACSSFVTNCQPFDNATRVPGWPDHIPSP